MLKNIVITCMPSVRTITIRCFDLLAWGAVALAITSCGTAIEPATPTLISIEGHGTFHAQNNVFQFADPVDDTASHTVIHYTGSRVRFTVPYPTSIDLAINGKPLAKVDPPQSSNYEYAGDIDNPGSNPATWSVGIKTPFDVPLLGTASKPSDYVLTIVNVSGSKQSPPLTIQYKQPVLYTPFPISGTHRRDTESSLPGHRPPCEGGALEKEVRLCLTKPPHDPKDITVTSCSFDAAVKLFQPPYLDWEITQGPCGP